MAVTHCEINPWQLFKTITLQLQMLPMTALNSFSIKENIDNRTDKSIYNRSYACFYKRHVFRHFYSYIQSRLL